MSTTKKSIKSDNTMNELKPLSSKSRVEKLGRIETMLSKEPEILTRADLYESKLSSLTKNLGQKLSSRRVIDTYLRWLEAQRLGETHGQNLHWDNLQKQWVVAVKGRGFTENEIIQEVQKYQAQAKYAPQGRPVMTESLVRHVFNSGFPAKQPPTQPRSEELRSNSYSNPNEINILKRSVSSWDHTDTDEEKRYYDGSNKRAKTFPIWESNSPQETISPSYTCKRCNVKGHLLFDCPTNLDPDYDRPPAADYFCRGCGAKGVHYFTLCPKNMTPDCLFQLREASRAKARKERHLAETFGKPPSRYKPQKVERLKFEDEDDITTDTTSKSKVENNLQSNTFDSLALRNSKSEFEGRLDLIESYNSKKSEERKRSLSYSADESAKKKDPFIFSANTSTSPRQTEQRFDENKTKSDDGMDLAALYKPEVAAEKMHVLDEMQLDGLQWNIVQPGEKYSPRVMDWMKRGILSSEIINKRARRPTALEMWDRDDEERAQRELQYEEAETKLQSEDEKLDGQDILSPLDTSEPQVMRVTQLDTATTEQDVRDFFDGYNITAISLWKPSYVQSSSTISAFVSLLDKSKAEGHRCCQDLSGRYIRANKIRVSRLNSQDAFLDALKEFQVDREGNRKWQDDTVYKQHHHQHRQILQHLRMTAAFEQNQNAEPSQELPNGSRSFAPSPSSNGSDGESLEGEYVSAPEFIAED